MIKDLKSTNVNLGFIKNDYTRRNGKNAMGGLDLSGSKKAQSYTMPV